ncbi:MAG: flagellar motor switch protein FliN [Anaerolineae bacterium]
MSDRQDSALDPSPVDSSNEPAPSLQTDGDHEPDTPFDVHPASFPDLAPSAEPGLTSKDLAFLEDVGLEIAVELGRAEMSLRQVLGLAPGVVIELDKLAGEPVDILVNGKLVGRGEVVIIEDMFGVRVTEIIPPSQRWKYR